MSLYKFFRFDPLMTNKPTDRNLKDYIVIYALRDIWFIIFLMTSIVNFIFYFDSMASIQSTYSTNSRHSSATAWKEYYRSQFPTSYTVLVILQINIVILFVKYSGYLSMWLLWYRDIDYINRMLVENKSSFFCKTELGLVQFGHFCLLKTFI
jgi:hypothetical protein